MSARITGLLIFLVFAATAANAAGIDPNVVFEKANSSYLKGDYEQALRDYKALADEYRSARLFYNIGNVYAATGDVGRAVLWFERARRLDPANDDIKFNLNVMRDKVARLGAAEVVAENPQIFRGLNTFFGNISFDILQPAFFACYGLFALVLLIFSIKKYRSRVLKLLLVASMLLMLVGGSLYGGKAVYTETEQQAVVIGGEVNALEGPDESFKKLFSIPEGWVVDVVEQRPAWMRVRLPNGLSGWLPQQVLGEI